MLIDKVHNFDNSLLIVSFSSICTHFLFQQGVVVKNSKLTGGIILMSLGN